MKCPRCDLEMDTIATYTKNQDAVRMKMGCPRCKIIWKGSLAIELDRGIEARKIDDPGAVHLLKNLLAIVHRDGGHYTDEHGLEKSVEDAMEIVVKQRPEPTEAPEPRYRALFDTRPEFAQWCMKNSVGPQVGDWEGFWNCWCNAYNRAIKDIKEL